MITFNFKEITIKERQKYSEKPQKVTTTANSSYLSIYNIVIFTLATLMTSASCNSHSLSVRTMEKNLSLVYRLTACGDWARPALGEMVRVEGEEEPFLVHTTSRPAL